MSLVSQTIDNLLNGVSQQPPRLRLPSQSEAETNTVASKGEGLRKRPPAKHVAKLSSTVGDAFVYPITVSEDERYLVVITEGSAKVYDAETGASVTVNTPDGVAYISGLLTQTFFEDTTVQAGVVALTAHTPTGGGAAFTWTAPGTSGGLTVGTDGTGTNVLRIPDNSASHPQPNVVGTAMSTADYDVSLTVKIPAYTDRQQVWGVFSRADANGYNGYTAILKQIDASHFRCNLYSSNGSNYLFNLLDQVFIDSDISGTDHVLMLRVRGTTISTYLDGVLQSSVTDATYSSAGHVGIYADRASGGTAAIATAHDFDVTLPGLSNGAGTGDPALSSYLRAVTIQDATVLVNRAQTVAKGTTSSTVRSPEALIYIRQADYGTTYTVTINGDEAAFTTSDTGRALIATDYIATQLLTQLEAVFTSFTFTRYGSTIHVTRSDAEDFTIGTKDGLADAGLIVIKDTIQRFSDLPAVAVDGFIVEITGDPGTDADNYWVQYTDGASPNQAGIWVETVRPGRLTALNASTLPHLIIKNGSIVPEFTSGHKPKTPTLAPYGSGGVQKVGFLDHFWDIDTTPSGGSTTQVLETDGVRGYSNLKYASGLNTQFKISYDVTTETMDPANALTVTVQYNTTQGSTTWTTAATKRYEGNHFDQHDSLTFTAPIPTDCDISVLISYDFTPIHTAYVDQRAQVTLYSRSTSPAGVEFTPATDIDLTFDAAETYPVGYTLVLDIDGTPVTYTVATQAITGADFATALLAPVTAVTNIDSSNPSPGVLRITRTTSGLAAVSITSAASAISTYAWQEAGTLTADALTGMTVKNVTDGSSATITDNGVDWIQVSALTGGSTNKFNPGDSIEVIDTAHVPYFVFRQADWAHRLVGDDTSNPFPSFTGTTIDEVFFHEGRLGFTSGPNVLCSDTDDLFNFFRTTVTALRDSDPIDVTSTSETVQTFHAAIEWDEKLILWAEQGQFALTGSPTLSPRTVSIQRVAKYESTKSVRPSLIGRGAFFLSKRLGFTQVSELRTTQDGLHAEAYPLTRELPRYLAGTGIQVAGAADVGTVVVLTDNDPSALFAYCFEDTPDGRIIGGWRTWQFSADAAVRGVCTFGPQLALVVEHNDGLYLETIDLWSQTEGSLNSLVHLDRLLNDWTGAAPSTSGGFTTFTLPYTLATDNSDGTVVVVNASTGAVIACTRPTSTTVKIAGTWTAAQVYVGVTYPFLYTFSRIFLRNAQGAQASGRLDLRWLALVTERTLQYTLRVAQLNRTDRTRTYTGTDLGEITRRWPVLGRTETVTISVEDTSPFPLGITAADWEGYFTSRSQRA